MIEFRVCDFNDDYDSNFPGTMMSVESYLTESPVWSVALEDTFLIFESLSEEQNMEINTFGVLEFLIPQLREIALQLRSGEDALLRTAGDFGATFFLFEHSDSTLLFSILGQFPTPLNSYFPLTKSPKHVFQPVDQKKALYDYLSKHKAELKADLPTSFVLRTITDIPIDVSELIDAIDEQAEWGDRLVEKTYDRA